MLKEWHPFLLVRVLVPVRKYQGFQFCIAKQEKLYILLAADTILVNNLTDVYILEEIAFYFQIRSSSSGIHDSRLTRMIHKYFSIFLSYELL